MKKFLFFIVALTLTACGALKPTTCFVQPNFYKYRYVYIMPTGSVTGSTGVYTSYVDKHVTSSFHSTSILDYPR